MEISCFKYFTHFKLKCEHFTHFCWNQLLSISLTHRKSKNLVVLFVLLKTSKYLITKGLVLNVSKLIHNIPFDVATPLIIARHPFGTLTHVTSLKVLFSTFNSKIYLSTGNKTPLELLSGQPLFIATLGQIKSILFLSKINSEVRNSDKTSFISCILYTEFDLKFMLLD